MGRGRAKAKQTKVARELKYFSPDTDLSALQRELGGHPTRASVEDDHDPSADDPYSDDPHSDGAYADDPYADLAAKYADDYGDEPAPDTRRTVG